MNDLSNEKMAIEAAIVKLENDLFKLVHDFKSETGLPVVIHFGEPTITAIGQSIPEQEIDVQVII